MLSLSTTQLAIIAASYKKVSWLFEVIPADKLTTYFWSTITRSYGGFDYTYKIPPSFFQGITLNRAKSEIGIQAPNDLSFTVLNSDSALSASDFINGSVILRLVVSDGTNEDQIRIWEFDVKQCESQYRKLLFVCQDFVQKYLEGDYPNTKLVKDILRSTDTDLDDNICVTVPFGECYSPLRSLYVTDGRYYVLGGGSGETGTGSGETYAIQRVRSPRSQGAKSEWNSGEYTFSQSEKTIGLETWDVFQPIIADSDADGVADACGLWKDGDHFEDMPTQFLRSDTASLTNPADVIEFVLENIGVREMEFDFGASFDVYAGWGLDFNGSYFYKQPREKVLAQLVNMCHSTLIVTDRVELHVLSKVSQKTITKADIIRTSEIGEGTFSRTSITQEQSDSGHIAFQEADEAQDEFLKALVPAKSNMDNISSEILEIPFVQDSQDAQRIGILYYQRKLLREADIGFTSKGTLLALQPDDVITIDHTDYGGTYDVLIDSITIKRDLSIDFQCTKFSEDLDDWEDLSPDAITFVTDDTGTYWAPVISGPTGTASTGQIPSVVPGSLIVGVPPAEYILIDPANQKIESSDYVSGSAGTGFHLSPDLLEVGNIACRGIFRTAVFQKDVLSVVSGGVVVTKGGDVLAEDMTALDASTLKIEGNETFPVGDLLRIKNENDDEWLEVTNIASAPTYTVTRDKEGAYGADSNPAWTKGASVTNYGQSGDGGILLTASETNAPYMNIFTHAGSPWSALTERLRVGNLNGFLDYASDLYGIAIGETNKYLKYDPTNGLRIKGVVSADAISTINADIGTITAGTLSSSDWAADAGVRLDLDNKWLKMGGSDVTAAGAAAGIFLGLDTSYKFYVGDGSDDYFKYDGTNVTISVSAADAITIKSGANIKIKDGGDVVLESGATPGRIEFIPTSGSNAAEIKAISFYSDPNYWLDCSILPTQGSSLSRLFLGDNTYKWQGVHFFGSGHVTVYFGANSASFEPTTTTLRASPNGTINLGDATYFWNDLSYKTITDRGCLGWFDEGVEMLDGRVVSDFEAIKLIQKDTRPGKRTVYGVPMLDYRTMPKAVYRPATEKDVLLPRDKNDEPYNIDKDGKQIQAADGAEVSALISIIIGAIKELGVEIEGLKT